MKKYKYEIIVLLSSVAVMVLELTATRLLSPYVGTSNIVWTSIIGIILASMAIGYYTGGIMAEKNTKSLGLIILGTGIYISIIPLLEVTVIDSLTTSIENLKVSSVLASIILFAIPSMLLAAVYPFCMKLKEIKEDKIATTAGKLSFYSTIGSIVGTFITGFWLLPLIGNRMILITLSLLLIGISFILLEKNLKTIVVIVISIVVSFLSFYLSESIFKKINPNILLDKDTEYNRVIVANLDEKGESRELSIGNRRQSISVADLSKVNYYNYFDLMDELNPEFQDVLLIGGGGYSYPKNFVQQFEDKNLDVVEIDGELVEIAKEYFDYEIGENVTNYYQDGRSFLNQNTKKYDVILLDAYKGVVPPFELVTVEALQLVKNSLNENGVVIANIMGATKGDNSRLLKAEYKTYNEVFDEVLFLTRDAHSERVRTNIFIAFKDKNDIKLEHELFETIVEDFKVDENVVVLTDDYAPVEYYTSKY